MNNILQLECLERDIIRDVKKHQVFNLGPIEIGESVERVMMRINRKVGCGHFGIVSLQRVSMTAIVNELSRIECLGEGTDIVIGCRCCCSASRNVIIE